MSSSARFSFPVRYFFFREIAETGAFSRLNLRAWKNFYGQCQGCQIVYFQTQNPNFGTFWIALVREL
jgi:hypothetical protein